MQRMRLSSHFKRAAFSKERERERDTFKAQLAQYLLPFQLFAFCLFEEDEKEVKIRLKVCVCVC